MMCDMNCLCGGEVDDCEVWSYAVRPPASSATTWSCPPIVPGEKLCSFSTSLSFDIRGTLPMTEPP